MGTPRRSSRHKKRDSDLLAELPDNVTDLGSGQSSATGSDNLLSRIILGPLTMISFLLSLCIVDRQQRAWRVAQHQPDSGSWWKMLSPWWNAEPYQSPHDSTWGHAVQVDGLSHGAHGNVPATTVDTVHWHTRKKHRKMAKLTLSDALDMRGRMAFALVAAGLLGLVATTWLLKRLFSSLV